MRHARTLRAALTISFVPAGASHATSKQTAITLR
jgi:hypothetical protein